MELLNMIGFDVSSTGRTHITPRTDFYGWCNVLKARELSMSSHEKVSDERNRQALNEYLYLFSSVKATGKRSAWNIVKDFSSMPHYVWKYFKAGDIDWRECNRASPVYTMRYILSYLLDPYVPSHEAIPPTDSIRDGQSTYFAQWQYSTPEIERHLDAFVATLPTWIVQLWKKEIKLTKDELIQLISTDDNKWFDKFMVSKLGDNPKGGGQIITESNQPGARRMLLSSEIHGKRYSGLWKCYVEEGYGYSYSFLPKCWMGARCLRDYPHLSELVISVWKQVWHHLDPVSQQCPPNAIGLLWYFGMFGGMIQPHQDACVRMAIDPSHNSQLLGSSVMVISLFFPQEFILTPIDSDKAPPIGMFLTEHASVYILSYGDDAKWKHRCKFPNGHRDNYRQKVRLSIVGRWLGRRTKMFCEDRHDWRRFREVYIHADKVLAEKFPYSTESQEIFKMKRQRKERMTGSKK
jgi:hypothetical protein